MTIQRDKIYHFLAGLGIACVATYFWSQVLATHDAALIAWLIASAIGALKEAGDKWGGYGGDCDVYDWLATTYGGTTGAIITALILSKS